MVFRLLFPGRGSSSKSSSGSTLTPRSGGSRSPSKPGSSKADYTYALDPSWSYDDLPPSYANSSSDSKARPVESATPTSSNAHTRVVHDPTDSVGESPLRVLLKYDIVIIFDDSASMLIADGKSRRSRWEQAWDAVEILVCVGSKYDKDGIEIHFLNKREKDTTVMNEADVRRLRTAVGLPGKDTYTPLGDVLDTLLLEYMQKTGDKPGRRGVKKRIFLVITDGAASDAPEDSIARAANFFHKGQFPLDQVGVQFIQVGNDPEATKFLEDLDEDLTGCENTRDMVDTIKSTGDDLEGDALIKALTGGFNRRQDRAGERRKQR